MSRATDNLRDNQGQLDMDGVEVRVSRQAVCETLEQYAELLDAAKQGEELRDWICGAISKAMYEQEEHTNPDAWKSLADAMFDGTLASYTDAFAPAITKAGG